MSRGKRYKTEEIIKILREVEIYTAKGQGQFCKNNER